MSALTHEEKTLMLQLKACTSMKLHAGVMQTLVRVADMYIVRGETQEGADVLAYVLRQQLPDDVFIRARDLYEGLETWICPRVLMDAQYFADRATLDDIIEYVLSE
ncbi:MAG: hypothetical protein ACPG7F_20220 [Aggregatilineales bacterium]